MFRTVDSSCCAKFSWTEKTSSFRARTKKAAFPPKTEKGLITIAREQRKVESRRARERLVVHRLRKIRHVVMIVGAISGAFKFKLPYGRETDGSFKGRSARLVSDS